jgi:hypothetical protein
VGGEREGMKTSLASVLILMASGVTGLTIGVAQETQ